MLKLTHITVHAYGKIILRDISQTVNEGDFVVIVGHNGSGKSTLLNVIAGNIKPSTGTIHIDDINVTNWQEYKRARFMSRLFQNPQDNGVMSMSVEENLCLALLKNQTATCASWKKGWKNHSMVHDLLSYIKLPFAQLLKTKMGSLSGGQRQLVAFTMATLTTPRVLLFDEPTASLDPETATALLTHTISVIKEHHITTLLITHDPELARAVGNKIWALDDGAIIKSMEHHKDHHLLDKVIENMDYERIKQAWNA